jgi:hypothetical protein
MLAPNVLPPLQWALEHVSAIGWPVIVYCAWKVAGYFKSTAIQAEKTIGQIDTMATNHFPHMQASLERQDNLLHSMDQSLKSIATHGWNISVTPQKPKRPRQERS